MKYLLLIACVLLLVSVAISVDAQTIRPDRTSFYNVPSDSKLESHIDYADGHSERKPYGSCVPGHVFSETLNLYTISWTVEGCTNDIHQHLNLRWVGSASSPTGCRFDFEHDPWARIVAYSPHGQQTIVGHYDQGEVELALGTDVVSMTVVMSHTEGVELWTGNALFVFNEPLDCTSAPEPTDYLLPAQTPTEAATATPEPPSATETPTTLPEPSSTATEQATTVVVCCPDVPETPTPTSVPPTALTPESEPGVKRVYLPLVER